MKKWRFLINISLYLGNDTICNASAGVRVLEQRAVWGGAHGERVEREPITGVWGQSPQRGPGAELDLKALNDAVHLTASLCYVYQVVYTFVRLC